MIERLDSYKNRKVECSCGCDSYEYGFKDSDPVWICNNCGTTTKRQIRKSSVAKEMEILINS